jgi:ATP-dependent helicase/DNAse subunit B
MPITLVTGPANAGKAQVVMDAVRRHLAHGAEPLLIVPTRADVEHYLRELAAGQAVMGVRVEQFAGLVGEAVRRAGVLEPVLGEVARERLLEALATHAEGPPAAPGLVRALGELLADLQQRRVTPARLNAALSRLAADGPGAPAGDLGSLFADYRATLERLGLLDPEQRAVRALDALRERPALWGQTPVLFYGFDDLTTLQLDAIETLGRLVGASVTVSLPYEPGRTAFAGRAGTFQALAPLAAEHLALQARAEYYAPHARAALSHLERSLFEPGAVRIHPAGAVRLLEGGGERAELELVAGEIASLLDEEMPADEIAVLARAGGTSAPLLEEVFSAAAIPFALQRRRRFGDTAVGRALNGLLRCVPARDGASAGQLGDLLDWLRAPGLLDRPGLADSLEIGARRSGALSAEQARTLWETRHWHLDTIDHLAEAQGRGGVALLDRVARELYWLFCAPRRAGASVLTTDELDDAGALAAGRRALAELRELARIAPELAPSSAGELARSLADVRFYSGERPLPGAVAVLDPLGLRARRVRALFLCGLQEAVFPSRARPQPLLSEEERRRLAEVSGLRLGEPEDVLAADRYLLYASLSRPEERLYLSWHVADDDGEATSRSLFVEDLCDLFDHRLSEDRLRRPLGAVDEIGPGADTPGRVPPPAGAPVASVPVTADAPVPSVPVTAGAPAQDDSLHDEHLLAGLRAHVWSPSSLQRWIGCPVAWFVDRMLDPKDFDPEPEPLARGGLAHAALKDTLEGLRTRIGTARVTPASLGLGRELLETALAQNEAEHPLPGPPERRIAVRRSLHSDLERYLRHAADVDSPLEPRELELGFGFEEGDERGEPSTLPAFELADGVKLRGRIDRVDVSEAGDAVVYDYKSSRAPAAARWLKDGDLQVALYMRAVEGLLGLRAVGGFYQPLSGEDLRARGLLEEGTETGLECMTQDLRESSELRELLAEAVSAAAEAAAEAGRGELAARPETCAFRGGCLYPTICRCER